MPQLPLPTDADDDDAFVAKMSAIIERDGGAELLLGHKKHVADRKVYAPWERGADVALPPCLATVASRMQNGQNVGHIGRFALAAFLLKRDVEPGAIAQRFVNAPNYSEKVTEAQVAQIQERGYAPPGCVKLRQQGLCAMDDFCRAREMTTPLQYPRTLDAGWT